MSKAWPAFGAPTLSVAGLLAHTSGLATCIPSGTRLRHLLEPLPMAEWLAAAAAGAAAGTAEAATSAHVPGGFGGAEFEGAPWGWAVAGLLHAVAPEGASASSSSGGGGGGGGGFGGGGGSGDGGGGGGCEWSLQALLEQRVTSPLGIQDELRLSLTPRMSERAARFTTSPMMRELGLEISDMISGDHARSDKSAPPPAAAAAAPDAAATAASTAAPKATAKAVRAVVGSDNAPDVYEQSAADGAQWERFQGAQQLQSPATLNAAQLRAACVPGVSAHGSARALSRFYASLAAGGAQPAGGGEPAAAAAAAAASASSGLRLPHAALARAARPASSGMLNSAPATWGLGFQLGRVVDASGRSLPLVGHLGLGGVAGLAVPAAGVALAVTVSQLSVRCAPTRRLVELLLRECGLRLEPGFLPEDD